KVPPTFKVISTENPVLFARSTRVCRNQSSRVGSDRIAHTAASPCSSFLSIIDHLLLVRSFMPGRQVSLLPTRGLVDDLANIKALPASTFRRPRRSGMRRACLQDV